jgi:protein gp37
MGTKIQWADETWNPFTGCTPVSEACDHCYAKAQANLHEKAWGYGFEPLFHPDRLDIPLHWRKPRRIFVNSMSDLFHEAFTDAQILSVLNVVRQAWNRSLMGHTPHTFMVLTKRPGRMHDIALRARLDHSGTRGMYLDDKASDHTGYPILGHHGATGLPNLWLGVTVENESHRDRLDILKATPAALRFVSYEPALGPFGEVPEWLDWFICGPETGPGKRAFDPWWAVEANDQCTALGIPYFDKRDTHADWREFPS